MINEVYSSDGCYLGNYYHGQVDTVGHVWNAIRYPDDTTGTFRTKEEAEAWIRRKSDDDGYTDEPCMPLIESVANIKFGHPDDRS